MSDTIASIAARLMAGGSIHNTLTLPSGPRSGSLDSAQQGASQVLALPTASFAALSMAAATPLNTTLATQKPAEEQQPPPTPPLIRGPSLFGSAEQLAEARSFLTSATNGRPPSRARATDRPRNGATSHDRSISRPSYTFGADTRNSVSSRTDRPTRAMAPTLATTPKMASSAVPASSSTSVVPVQVSQQQQLDNSGYTTKSGQPAGVGVTESTKTAARLPTPPHLRGKQAAVPVMASRPLVERDLNIAEPIQAKKAGSEKMILKATDFTTMPAFSNLVVQPRGMDAVKAATMSPEETLGMPGIPSTGGFELNRQTEQAGRTVAQGDLAGAHHDNTQPSTTGVANTELDQIKAITKAPDITLASQVAQLEIACRDIPSIKAAVEALSQRFAHAEKENFELLGKVEIMTQMDEQRRYLGTKSAKAPFQISVERTNGTHEHVQVSAALKISDLIRRARVAHNIMPHHSINPRIVVDGKEIGHGMTLHEAAVTEASSVELRYDEGDEVDEEL